MRNPFRLAAFILLTIMLAGVLAIVMVINQEKVDSDPYPFISPEAIYATNTQIAVWAEQTATIAAKR